MSHTSIIELLLLILATGLQLSLMILAFDTYYKAQKAHTACVVFNTWEDAHPQTVYTETREGVEDYKSGEFYKRELPCIMSLLEKIATKNVIAILIDGFVYVDDNGKPGLGGHLYESLNRLIPVVGVAKTNFFSVEKLKRHVLRGISRVPLYVTAAGMDVDEAVACISRMSGEYRMPSILKQLDAVSRSTD
jgi:deoxyribonuclease V